METQISSSFIYAILSGIVSVLAFVYVQKQYYQKKERHPLYYAGIFFIVSNIVYNISSPDSPESQMRFNYNTIDCQMKTGQPTF